ncbi:MAG: type II toxin-antitoxin system death-on-curing family toxin [Firmicutes bacterium]|nr:type II toxin-antitoxin system death-on-curing family toxin [Bacillota bacterium]
MNFSKEKMLLLHQYMAEQTGGGVGLRDAGLLDSAVQSAFQTFDGAELYPTKQEKAARIGHSLISNHAFVDGNKRMGMYVMISFLEMNGIRLNITDDEIVNTAKAVATGKMKYDALHKWILNNS